MGRNTPLIIAVDGGGSTCRVALADASGRVLATASGPSANVTTALEGGIAAMLDTLEKARAKAGLSADDIAAACAHVGLAGVKSPRIAKAVAAAFPATRVTVTEDRPTTMAGALGAADGYVAAIGTGSFLGGQTGGRQHFVGGWGLMLGDQASGAWLGRQLLSQVLEWQDGLREATDLLSGTLAAYDGDPMAIVAFAADNPPDKYAELAPRLLDAAQTGDAAGVEIVRDGAAYIQRALNRLGFRDGDRLCLTGGIGPRYAAFLDATYKINLTPPEGTALDGALRLALAQACEGSP